MVKATTTETPMTICSTCGADPMGCAVKLGLGGKRCCDQCDHVEVRKVSPRDDRRRTHSTHPTTKGDTK